MTQHDETIITSNDGTIKDMEVCSFQEFSLFTDITYIGYVNFLSEMGSHVLLAN
jgi:hypothetical protein